MTKADLIQEVCKTGHLTRKDSDAIIDTLFECIIETLRRGEKIEIRGFGSFRTRLREARAARNPKSGQMIPVPARHIPYFRPSKDLRDLLNPSPVEGSPLATAKAE